MFLCRLVFRELDTIADEAPQFQLEMFSSLILYKTYGTPLGKQKIPGPTQQCRPRKKSYFVCRDCNSIVHFIYSILLDADRMTNSVQPSFSMIIGWRSKTKENRQAPSRLYAQSQDSHSSKSPGGMVSVSYTPLVTQLTVQQGAGDKFNLSFVLPADTFRRQGPDHTPVSYTHLDVYKRQPWASPCTSPVTWRSRLLRF